MADKKIFFNGGKGAFMTISEILEKNGLKESLDEAFDKTHAGKISMVDVLYRLSKDLAVEKITEKDFISEVQKRLGTTDIISQNINKDIKSNLLPFFTTEEEAGKKEQKTEKRLPIAPVLPVKKIKPMKEPIIPEKQEIKKTMPRGPDKYRESI